MINITFLNNSKCFYLYVLVGMANVPYCNNPNMDNLYGVLVQNLLEKLYLMLQIQVAYHPLKSFLQCPDLLDVEPFFQKLFLYLTSSRPQLAIQVLNRHSPKKWFINFKLFSKAPYDIINIRCYQLISSTRGKSLLELWVTTFLSD